MKEAGFVYLNGRVVAARAARLSVFDRGLQYGDGLMETLRADDGRVTGLRPHLDRLHASAAFFEIPMPRVEWGAAIAGLLRRNRCDRGSAWIRITLTRGPASRGLAPPPKPSPTLVITVGEIDPVIHRQQRRGVRLVPVPFCRDPFLAGHKTLNYVPGILAKAAAVRAGAHDALYTDRRGHALETTTANLFTWRGDELWTPKRGILPGITRDLVMDLARKDGFRVRERPISVADLVSADEAFLTSSLVEVLPLVRMADARIGSGRPGARTRRLQAQWAGVRAS